MHVAVVGAGPSGIFATSFLLECSDTIQVDVWDRDPTPFGLVRYGVAPDHLKIKSVSKALTKILSNPRVVFRGNIDIGRNISVAALQEHYDAVVLATGAPHGRRLDVPGHNLAGHLDAAEFVRWYNGHPSATPPTLAGPSAAVVGAGNAALDVARVLLKGPAGLEHTDVPDHVLTQLGHAAITDVHLIARRGPAEAKFSANELLDLGAIPGLRVSVADGLEPGDEPSTADTRSVSALKALLAGAGRPAGPPRHMTFHFNRTPVVLRGSNLVTGIVLQPPLVAGQERPAELLEAATVISCIGFTGVPTPGVLFDEQRGVVPNEGGRVSPGLYVTGWAKRGASGVIGANKACAHETVNSLLADFEGVQSRRDLDASALLTPSTPPWTTWRGWTRIDAAERELGEQQGRPRVKIHNHAELVRLGSQPSPVFVPKGDTGK